MSKAAIPCSPLLSPRFSLALQFANQIHATQVRKGLGAPYISHLMSVSALVLEYGGDEDQAIAALLHDAAEDCGGRPMLETVRVMFGNGVASIVECCTDTFEDPKPAWWPRKEAYVGRMKHEPARARLVVTADKLHNLSNTLRDIRAQGPAAWKANMSKSPNGATEKQIWYFQGCRDALATGWSHPLLSEFSRAVDEFKAMVGGRP
jgi:(p)ppGpp synthase/HD superfamily hydrolase